MFLKKEFFILYLLLSTSILCNAQIEVAHVSLKDFKANGFAGFLNFSKPVSDAGFVTFEAGFQYFINEYSEDLALIPVLAGYRYTLNQSGSGFYVEPNAGYIFGASTIERYDENGSLLTDGGDVIYAKVSGPAAGLGFGYLFQPSGKIQFNLGLRYQHGFSQTGTNLFSLRISHAFSFSKKSDD